MRIKKFLCKVVFIPFSVFCSIGYAKILSAYGARFAFALATPLGLVLIAMATTAFCLLYQLFIDDVTIDEMAGLMITGIFSLGLIGYIPYMYV